MSRARRARSAVTGRFVAVVLALREPERTIVERPQRPGDPIKVIYTAGEDLAKGDHAIVGHDGYLRKIKR